MDQRPPVRRHADLRRLRRRDGAPAVHGTGHGRRTRRAARLRGRAAFQLSAPLHDRRQGAAVEPCWSRHVNVLHEPPYDDEAAETALDVALHLFHPPLTTATLVTPDSQSTPWRARLETRLLVFATLVTGVARGGHAGRGAARDHGQRHRAHAPRSGRRQGGLRPDPRTARRLRHPARASSSPSCRSFAPISPTHALPATAPRSRRWPTNTAAAPAPTSCSWPPGTAPGRAARTGRQGPSPTGPRCPAAGAPRAPRDCRGLAVLGGRRLPGGAGAGAVRGRGARLAGDRLPARRPLARKSWPAITRRRRQYRGRRAGCGAAASIRRAARR